MICKEYKKKIKQRNKKKEDEGQRTLEPSNLTWPRMLEGLVGLIFI